MRNGSVPRWTRVDLIFGRQCRLTLANLLSSICSWNLELNCESVCPMNGRSVIEHRRKKALSTITIFSLSLFHLHHYSCYFHHTIATTIFTTIMILMVIIIIITIITVEFPITFNICHQCFNHRRRYEYTKIEIFVPIQSPCF